MKINSIKIMTIMMVLICLLSNTALASSPHDDSVKKGVVYLKSLSQSDGGFSERPGAKSDPRISEWIVMALHAAGEDTAKHQRFILNHTELDATTDYARKLMALRATGYSGTVNGIRLEDTIISFQKQNGQFSQYDKGENQMINAHVWSVLALASAEKEIPNKDKARQWLLAQQSSDGGFSWQVGGISDSDSTGVSITALIVLGENPSSSAIRRAVAYINSNKGNDGAISSGVAAANSASTSWALQGLLAAGEKPDPKSFSYLKQLQNKNGSFLWMENRESSTALMTAYAMMALSERPFPVNINVPSKAGSNLAKKQETKIVLYVDRSAASINQRNVTLDTPPVVIQQRTMVPLRFIAEALAAEIDWDESSKTITLKTDKKELTMTVGQRIPGMDIPPTMINGRTMVPVRYVSEAFGADVTWDGVQKMITISR